MLTESELIAILESHRANSLGDEKSELSSERADAMDHYHGRAYGDEQDGRSQVVSKDLAETIDWIMPPIMKAITQSGGVVSFDPVSDDDEEKAQQETDYINHVLMKDNDGFLILHDWIKDCLLLKTGYVKHFWDESEKTTEESYSGLSEIDMARIFQELEEEGAEVEVVEQDSELKAEGEVFEFKLRVTRTKGRARVEAVPAEEIRISKRARKGTQDSQFIEHFTLKTRTELIEMGMDDDWVNELPAHSNMSEEQSNARDSVSSESEDGQSSLDKAMEEIEYSESYLMIDYDEDGKAELRKIITCADKLPKGSDWNEVVDCVAITSVTSKRVPHRHIGESIDDDLSDLQRIKTTLQRQMLDNIYNTNNQQFVVNKRVILADFLQSLPGGVKRVNDDQPVNGSVMPLATTPILNQILPAIDYVDKVKDGRTGINKLSTDIDPDVLKETTKGAYTEAVSRASQKVEMIIRMIAETGVKELALRLHEILIKHQDKPRVLKLRGKYVPINPQEWKQRSDLTIKVGLGTGTEEERRQRLGMITQMQTGLKESGLVMPNHEFNLFSDVVESLGMVNPSRYSLDPMSEEYKQLQKQMANQPPPPNLLAEVEQIKGQFALERESMKAQHQIAIDQLKQDRSDEIELMKIQVDDANKEADRISKEGIETAKLEVTALLEGFKIDLGQKGTGAELGSS